MKSHTEIKLVTGAITLLVLFLLQDNEDIQIDFLYFSSIQVQNRGYD